MEVPVQEAIEKCRRQIEQKLGWGDSDHWSTHDYESLSAKIQKAANVNLSVATLKRIWGKVRYDSKPTMTTLNALAVFLGYENWHSFRLSLDERTLRQNEPTVVPDVARARRKVSRTTVTILLIAGAAVILLGFFLIPPAKKDPSQFSFSSKKVVSEGVPNTVIFDYDASKAEPSDSIFIRQSWDERLTTKVDRAQKQHTSIYYYPGFFEAKLIINEQVVLEHNLLIRTSGWLPLIEQNKVPIYLEPDVARQTPGIISITENALKENNVLLEPKVPITGFSNITEFANITSDNFIFETAVKNDYRKGSGACQYVEIRLQFEGPVILVPLSAKGCVSELEIGGIDGKKSDLSAFGCDFSTWVPVKIVTAGDIAQIFVNNVAALRLRVSGQAAPMVGIGFRFQGTGSVDYIRISKNNGDILFEENFD
jgi:hypothetical protein